MAALVFHGQHAPVGQQRHEVRIEAPFGQLQPESVRVAEIAAQRVQRFLLIAAKLETRSQRPAPSTW